MQDTFFACGSGPAKRGRGNTSVAVLSCRPAVCFCLIADQGPDSEQTRGMSFDLFGSQRSGPKWPDTGRAREGDRAHRPIREASSCREETEDGCPPAKAGAKATLHLYLSAELSHPP